MKLFLSVFLLIFFSQKVSAQSVVGTLGAALQGIAVEARKSDERKRASLENKRDIKEIQSQFEKECAELDQIFKILPANFSAVEIDMAKNTQGLDDLLSKYYSPHLEELEKYLGISFEYSFGSGVIESKKCIELTNSIKDENKKKCMLSRSIPNKCASLYMTSYYVEEKYNKLNSFKNQANANRGNQTFFGYLFDRVTTPPKTPDRKRTINLE